MKFPLCFALAIGFLVATSAHPQDAKPLPHHPDQILRYKVKLEGPDSEKVSGVTVYFQHLGNLETGQQGLNPSMGSTEAAKGADGVFHVEIKIPKNIASGTYKMSVNGFIRQPDLTYGFSWNDNDGVSVVIEVQNDLKFEKPKIVVKPE